MNLTVLSYLTGNYWPLPILGMFSFCLSWHDGWMVIIVGCKWTPRVGQLHVLFCGWHSPAIRLVAISHTLQRALVYKTYKSLTLLDPKLNYRKSCIWGRGFYYRMLVPKTATVGKSVGAAYNTIKSRFFLLYWQCVRHFIWSYKKTGFKRKHPVWST